MTPLFELDDVTVAGSDGPILDAVDLTVAAVGITVLLGPSGAGKSTLLRLCNRLEVPSHGQVRFRGTPLADLDPRAHRRRVGMVFQRPVVLPGDVVDNLKVADPDADDDRLGEVLDRVGLAVAPDRVADGLSGGEAQRLCVARTLLTDPDALLLDEPTSALDPAARRGVEELGRELADAGIPLLWVTHDLAQAERVADAAAVLVAGTVRVVGTLADVDASTDADVAAYLAGERVA